MKPLFALISALFLIGSWPALAGTQWAPIDPLELSLKSPVVEKDADAEALFWDVRVLDEMDGSTIHAVLSHYIRIKVFTDRGRDSQSTVDLTYLGGNKIQDIAGRTIKPNGDIVDLQKEAIYDRTLVKAGGIKVKAKSFAMPAVEPGSIIEYRWREVRNNELTNYVRLQFQREIPVRSVTYHIKPFSNPYFPYGMRTLSFRIQNSGFVKERDGFYLTTA